MFICKQRAWFHFCVFHSRKQLLTAVGATEQSSEILDVLWQIGVTVWWNITAVKTQQILLPKSSLQVTVILNVSEFHLVVNSSTCGESTWNGSLSSFMMSMCFLKSSNLCWKSSISLATNSEYFSCCTVSVGFVGQMETLGGPDSDPRAVCWTTSIILISNKVHNWDILVLACPGCPGKRPLNEWLYCLNCVLLSILMKFLKTGIDRFICITCDVASWYSFPFYIIVASDSSKWVEDKSRAVLESIMKSRRWMVEELISECVCFTWCHFAAINLHFCLISLFFPQICLQCFDILLWVVRMAFGR